MKKWIFIWLLNWSLLIQAQINDGYIDTEESIQTLQYDKNLNISEERTFELTPNSKYSGDAFQYNDHIKASKPEIPTVDTSPKVEVSSGLLRILLLVVLAVLAIIAILYRSDFSYFKLSKYSQKEEDKLSNIDDEHIDENDFEQLLSRAIQNNNFRLAIRYHYLLLLKNLSQKQYIEYHKDKTNTEYQFELKEGAIRSGFSYLSYIYTYVWYGEFVIDHPTFATIEKKYESFKRQLK